MSREVVTGTHLPPALGPYSPAVKAGNLLFVSAQTGVDPGTGKVPDGGVDAECRQALTNLAAVLRAVGGDLSNVVRTTIFYADLDDLPAINAVYAEHFPAEPPARSSAVVGLAGERRVSIDAIAVVA